jgi:glycosyltransferase involved in cell wall biosynthesis
LVRLYADCDAFIHPNPREPFGIPPLEAMATAVFNDPATCKDRLARARWTAHNYQWRVVADSFFPALR